MKLPLSPEGTQKFRILVVEDDAHIARLILTNMEKAGFDCYHAADGELALEVFRTRNPHLILLDLMLPKLGGREVCARIRETSTVPIIMLTAMVTEDDEVQGFKLGADDYVPKPFNPKLLVARVIAALRRVYRYAPEPKKEEKATAATPAGWATCESCGYMGPRQKFDYNSANGQKSSRCPFCKQSEFIVFSVG